MNCGHRGHHGDGHRSHHDCGCGQRGHHHGGFCGCFERRFWTKEEKIARLESYLESLQTEAQAVQERIAEMKGE